MHDMHMLMFVLVHVHHWLLCVWDVCDVVKLKCMSFESVVMCYGPLLNNFLGHLGLSVCKCVEYVHVCVCVCIPKAPEVDILT